MANVLIVIYLIIALALIAVILLQRSEGGGLGMGTSSGGLISVRGTANLLTRTTGILAALFFATAIGLTVLAELDRGSQSVLDSVGSGVEGTAPTNVLDAMQQLQQQSAGDLPVPADAAPAATDTAPAANDAAPATTDAAPAATEAAPAADPGLAVPTEAPATQTPAPAGN
jgi:preprotein translocase subunit SecG